MWDGGSQSPFDFGSQSQRALFGFSQESGDGGFGGSGAAFGSQTQQSQPLSFSQSQYGLSQASQLSQPAVPECTECHSTEMHTTDDGDMVCAVCGTAFEGNVNEVVEMEENMMVGINRRRVRKDNTPSGPKLDSKGRRVAFADTRQCLRAFQIVLVEHVKAFCLAAALSADATEEMKRVSSDLWFSYLERFTLPEACGHGGIRVREDFRSTQERAESHKARLAKEKRPGDSTSGDPDDFGGGDGVGVRRGTRSVGPINVDEQELASYGRGTADWNRIVAGARANPGYSLPPVTMPLVPAMLCVCARWLRSPILAVDVVRWITDGSLPYMGSVEVLPAELKEGLGKARSFFSPSAVPVAVHVSTLADRLSAVLGLELPPLNTPAVALRFAKGLGLPLPVLSDVDLLSRFGVGGPCFPNPATIAPASDLFVSKRHRSAYRSAKAAGKSSARNARKQKQKQNKSKRGRGKNRMSLKDFRKRWRRQERAGGGGGEGSGGGSGGGVSRKRARATAMAATEGTAAADLHPKREVWLRDEHGGHRRGGGGGIGGSSDGESQSGSGGDSSSSGSSSEDDSDSGSDECEQPDTARAEERLRFFLADASPVHAMALVVAAAKGCPGWESWSFTRPALLPSSGPGTAVAAPPAATDQRRQRRGDRKAAATTDNRGSEDDEDKEGIHDAASAFAATPATPATPADRGDEGRSTSLLPPPGGRPLWSKSESWTTPLSVGSGGNHGGARSSSAAISSMPAAVVGRDADLSGPGKTNRDSGSNNSNSGDGGGDGPVDGDKGAFESQFVPTHSEELRLLLRGRLQQYLDYVESWRGGDKGRSGSWLGDGGAMSTALEDVAKEIEQRRLAESRHRSSSSGGGGGGGGGDCSDRSKKATNMKSAGGGGGGGDSSGGGDDRRAKETLMGCVRAAQIVASGGFDGQLANVAHAGATTAASSDGEEEEEEEEALRSDDGGGVGGGVDDDDDDDDGGGDKSECGGQSSAKGSRTTKGCGRSSPQRTTPYGKSSVGRGRGRGSGSGRRRGRLERLGPTVVYDPDDEIGRFHPQYELLVEACAFYLEVRPSLLHAKVQELDGILIEQADRALRREEKEGLAGHNQRYRLRHRLLWGGHGGVAEKGGHRDRRKAVSIARRSKDTTPKGKARIEEKKIRLALRRGNQAMSSKEGVITAAPPPLEPQRRGAFVVMGGDTLRPPPPTGSSTRGAGVGAVSTEAAVTGAAAAAVAPQKEQVLRPGDAELAYVMHGVGAYLNPFVDGSADALKKRAQRDKLSGPWSVRYGKEDGRPRWMKRVLPEVDFSELKSPPGPEAGAGAGADGARDATRNQEVVVEEEEEEEEEEMDQTLRNRDR